MQTTWVIQLSQIQVLYYPQRERKYKNPSKNCQQSKKHLAPQHFKSSKYILLYVKFSQSLCMLICPNLSLQETHSSMEELSPCI